MYGENKLHVRKSQFQWRRLLSLKAVVCRPAGTLAMKTRFFFFVQVGEEDDGLLPAGAAL